MGWKKSDIILFEYGIVAGFREYIRKKKIWCFKKKKGNAERKSKRERERNVFFLKKLVQITNEQ